MLVCLKTSVCVFFLHVTEANTNKGRYVDYENVCPVNRPQKHCSKETMCLSYMLCLRFMCVLSLDQCLQSISGVMI